MYNLFNKGKYFNEEEKEKTIFESDVIFDIVNEVLGENEFGMTGCVKYSNLEIFYKGITIYHIRYATTLDEFKEELKEKKDSLLKSMDLINKTLERSD